MTYLASVSSTEVLRFLEKRKLPIISVISNTSRSILASDDIANGGRSALYLLKRKKNNFDCKKEIVASKSISAFEISSKLVSLAWKSLEQMERNGTNEKKTKFSNSNRMYEFQGVSFFIYNYYRMISLLLCFLRVQVGICNYNLR